jgi:hypothetical protein
MGLTEQIINKSIIHSIPATVGGISFKIFYMY